MTDFRSLIPFGRSTIFRSGFDPFTDLRKEMDRLSDDFGRGWLTTSGDGGSRGFNLPRVDIAETDKGLELTAELPGFDEQDVSLDVQDDVLTIKAEHKEDREEKDEKKNYHLIERSRGSYLRRVALPFEADADKASAHLEKGLLKVIVPRLATEQSKPRQIPVGSK
ncbi:Hsp20/alpha crystallin family protein [Sphingobium sp. JS3065]|uniref:Hsp20/alpha crystallin family protein n=1 Tax=Sphingobium sp. JS3065 TaxID=2970925 RepID=UPI002264F468|nr:Hsp20/alpha crystallin family protein [Sphingobium sp. JS3065]UZW57112.1 Hsp20/alpha crystallin family protein [Sphingobium sp. JS3065]